ncbi:MAG: hypothetical protein LBV79_07640 [Candidatus Adiutrix sp.]|jgi:hypothetical protein|nr:hypothetical protein [Candidatus Adiutrix sp.]
MSHKLIKVKQNNLYWGILFRRRLCYTTLDLGAFLCFSRLSAFAPKGFLLRRAFFHENIPALPLRTNAALAAAGSGFGWLSLLPARDRPAGNLTALSFFQLPTSVMDNYGLQESNSRARCKKLFYKRPQADLKRLFANAI